LAPNREQFKGAASSEFLAKARSEKVITDVFASKLGMTLGR